MPMKLKMTEDGKSAVVQDGKPVYIHDDGKEVPFDADAAVTKIGQLNREAQGHREGKEAAEAKLKAFEGITDPAAAIAALTTVKNLNDKKLIEAGEVEKVKSEAIKAVEDKYAPVLVERDNLKKALDNEIVGGSFARSKFIADKLTLPGPAAQKIFGENFTVKDGKLVAKDAAGNPIYSKTKPGDLAEFDEALEQIVAASPYKDSFLKGSGGSGSGARDSKGNPTGPKTIKRADFDALDPAAKQAKIKEGFTPVD